VLLRHGVRMPDLGHGNDERAVLVGGSPVVALQVSFYDFLVDVVNLALFDFI